MIELINSKNLTTAEILYHLPDYPLLLQQFIWQEYDSYPDFPLLLDFLDFWQQKIDGKLHSIKVAHSNIIIEDRIRIIDSEVIIH